MSEALSGFADIVHQGGGIFEGIQAPLFPGSPSLVVFINPRTNRQLTTLEACCSAASVRALLDTDNGGKVMTLKEKLHSLYAAIDMIEKNGQMGEQGGRGQHYRYVRSVDVLNAIRQQLIALRVYADINFDFVGDPFTIARARELNAPFSAIRVKCTATFRDLDSNETITQSALGAGADTAEKAVYKAQTGALKYALKNAALAPDERAMDPEADPITNEDVCAGEPVYNSGRLQYGESVVGIDAGAGKPVYNSGRPQYGGGIDLNDVINSPASATFTHTETVAAPDAPAAPATVAAPASTPSEPSREPGDDVDLDQPPNEEAMNEFRTRFTKLGNDLTTQGKFKPSKGLPVNQKLLVFLLNRTGAASAPKITAGQWADFFGRVDAAVQNPEIGFVGLGKMINKVNGIEEKK